MLEMKYFILKPKAHSRDDEHATASQLAMITYANSIKNKDRELSDSLRKWATDEAKKQTVMEKPTRCMCGYC